ncbi:hypothetical protein BGX21_010005 [Mortierella sp. AD011]|nr:hypothetical protein BGX20_001034 [Mortierella sp. AD010]KAF9402463.1 hypothetical protein BGX21_010005 [Mortierella sp. AD011]
MDPKDTPSSTAKGPSCQSQQKLLHSALSDPANSRRQSSFTVRFAESALSPVPKSPLRPLTPRPRLTSLESFDYLPEIFDFKLLDEIQQDDNAEIDFSSRLTESRVDPTSKVTEEEEYRLSTSGLDESKSLFKNEEGVTERIEDLRYVDNLPKTYPIINAIDSPEKSQHDVTPENISLASPTDPVFCSKGSGKHFNLSSTVLSEFLLRTPSSVAPSTPQSTEISPTTPSWLSSPPLTMPIFEKTPRSARPTSFVNSKVPKLHHLDVKRKIAAPRIFKPSLLRFTTTHESPQHPLESSSSTIGGGSEAGPSTPPGSPTTFGGFTTPNTEPSEDDTIAEDSEIDGDTGNESVRDSVYSEVYYSADNENVDVKKIKRKSELNSNHCIFDRSKCLGHQQEDRAPHRTISQRGIILDT